MATALKTFTMMIKMKLMSTMMTPAAATTRIQKMKWQKKRTKHCLLLTHISATLVALFLSHNCLGCNLWTCTNKTHTIIRIIMQEKRKKRLINSTSEVGTNRRHENNFCEA
jgi:hypothetical protein